MFVGGFHEIRTDVDVTGFTFGLPGGLGGPEHEEYRVGRFFMLQQFLEFNHENIKITPLEIAAILRPSYTRQHLLLQHVADKCCSVYAARTF